MQFIFLGPPGAGKGTQANLLADDWRIPHVSTGDILRDAITQQTALGLQARTHVEVGELVPEPLIMSLMRERFGQADMQQGWILDGFPRTLAQANALDQLLTILRHPHPQVVYFEVATETLVERMLARGRQDDTEETIRRRLDVYQDDTTPLIDFYQRRQCLATIDGNLSLGDVTQMLQESLLQHQYSSVPT